MAFVRAAPTLPSPILGEERGWEFSVLHVLELLGLALSELVSGRVAKGREGLVSR